MATGGNKLLLELYRTMRRIRTFEERVNELFVRGQTAGSMLHMSIGEEAISGVCRAMEPGDSFTTHHRGHGIFIARGADPKRMMSEIAGKADGYCSGKGGSMHIADMGLGALGARFRRVSPARRRVGDLLLMAVAEDQLHLGVLTLRGFVHADARLRRVVETPGLPRWPVIAIYRRRTRLVGK